MMLGLNCFSTCMQKYLTCMHSVFLLMSETLYFNRITRYLDSWPKIEKWYNKFGVLTTVDASQGMQTVYLEVEKILEDTLAKVKLEKIKVAFVII